jgi:competence protein CoiA-like protein
VSDIRAGTPPRQLIGVPPTPRHTADEQVAATGDRIQIYAHDMRLGGDAPLFRLEPGQAAAVRADARAGHLVCPIPGCEDPRYTTRAGSKRDHFAHRRLVGGGHAPETWFHFTGKQVVGEWLRARYPIARVVVDHEPVENRQVPDVLCTFPDGRRFAFEVQYAPITEDEWTARHDGYVAHGIVDVWLFGHLRRYLRVDRYDDKRFIAVPLVAGLIKAGIRSYWINPDERTVGTRRDLTDAYRRQGYLEEEFDLRHGMSIAWEDIAACSIDEREFLTPTDRREKASITWFQAARRRQQEAEERHAREAEEAERSYWDRRAYVERKRQGQADEYARHIRPTIERDFAGEIADIEIELPTDRGVWLHPATWHARLFRERIRGRVGRTFTLWQMGEPFLSSTRYKVAFWEAIEEYLFHLYRAGYVRFDAPSDRIEDIEIVADTFEAARLARGW